MPRLTHLITLALLLVCATARSAPESTDAVTAEAERAMSPPEQPITRWHLQAMVHGVGYLQLAPVATDLETYSRQLDQWMAQRAAHYSVSF